MNLRRAEIGIILIAFNIPVFVDLIGIITRKWTLFIVYFIWGNSTIAGAFSVLTIVGLAFYIIGRKNFLKRAKSSEFISVLLVMSSLILIAGGILEGSGIIDSFIFYKAHIPLQTIGDFIHAIELFLPYFAWSVLAFISGILWLVDGVIALPKAMSAQEHNASHVALVSTQPAE